VAAGDGTGACCTTGALSGADAVVVAGDGFDAGRLECRQPAARTAIAVIGTMNFFATATLPISNAASGPSVNESGRRIAPSRRECSQPFTLGSGYRIDK
jgi:predicted phosphodiesterase